MPDGADPRIESPFLRELHAYWLSRRGDRAFPGRADFEPLSVPAVLPHLILIAVERGPATRFRVRLSGTFVDSVFGRAGTGRYLDESPINVRHPWRLEPYHAVAAEGRIDIARTRYVTDEGRRFDYERLLMPLALDDARRVDMIVGALAFAEPIATPGVPFSAGSGA